jgi:hypothetical protein
MIRLIVAGSTTLFTALDWLFKREQNERKTTYDLDGAA